MLHTQTLTRRAPLGPLAPAIVAAERRMVRSVPTPEQDVILQAELDKIRQLELRLERLAHDITRRLYTGATVEPGAYRAWRDHDRKPEELMLTSGWSIGSVNFEWNEQYALD